MKVVDFLAPDSIIPSLSGSNKGEALAELATFMAEHHSSIDAQMLRHVLEEREQLATTAIGDGIAIPHGKLDTVDRLVGILGRSLTGLDCDSNRRQADPPPLHAGGAHQFRRRPPQGARPPVQAFS